jgi:two-component system NtrC family sensor kinase
MRITTRLLLPLLATVTVVMLMFALWSLRQRELALTAHAQRETDAYATALVIALEAALRAGSNQDVQEAIDRISNERGIYGVIVYGADTRVLFTSQMFREIEIAPPSAVRRVIQERQPVSMTREIEEQSTYSIVEPLFAPDSTVAGAMEIVQPLRLLAGELRRTRQRFTLNTLTLIIALTLLIAFLTRRLIAEPLHRLMQAVRALGRGELGYRIEQVRGGAELAELAREFNGMAARIEQARTERERESEQRVVLARRLREAEKLAVVGNLAAGLAHEIAAPLHVIRGRAELLRGRSADSATERNLRIITDQIDRITSIMRNLLDYSRRREPRIEQIDAGELLRRTAEFLDPEFERAGVELILECPDAAPLYGDPDLLHQVFLNLMMNSLQVMTGRPAPRTMTVRCQPAVADDPELHIAIADTGPGLPGELMARIFEPFFTTKPPGEGTGLGLAVARSIIEDHGGRIRAETAEAGGARFVIDIRVAHPEAAVNA